MKRKRRNPYVLEALLRTGGGRHRKSNKALRKSEKQKGYEVSILKYILV